MDKDLLKGVKQGTGILLVFLLAFSVYAVGFHQTSEIVPGVFQGDYTFNGSVKFNTIKSNNTLSIDNGGGSNMSDVMRLYHGGNYQFRIASAQDSWGKQKIAFQQLGYDGSISSTPLYLDGGNVGIGTGNPSYKLDVNGNAIANNWYTHSDIRLKENITQLSKSLEKLQSINGVSYQRKDGNNRDIGVIAQKVEEVFPEAVSEDEEGYKSVAYSKMIAPIIESIKKQQKHINNLEKENENKQKQIDNMKNIICKKYPEENICD